MTTNNRYTIYSEIATIYSGIGGLNFGERKV